MPEQNGAFPTDPYSHSPMGGGARQLGMTGQVKAEIFTRHYSVLMSSLSGFES